MKNNNLQNAYYYLNNLIIALKPVLYKRTCQFFTENILGTILVCGTVSQWIKAVQLQKKFRKEYHHLQRLGYFDNHLQLQYAQWVIEQTIRFLPESARFIIACVTRSTTFQHGLRQPLVVKKKSREAIVEWKTCIAVSHLTDRSPIRIVVSRIIDISKDSCGHLVQHEGSWGMFISTDLNHDEQFILEQYSRRFSIEEMFKDLKEVCGLGKQQVRNFNSVKATTDLTLMSYTLVEFWSWDKSASELTQNRGIWDDPNRRPSHKNKRQAMQFELLWQNFSAVYARDLNPKKMQQLKNNMLELLLTS